MLNSLSFVFRLRRMQYSWSMAFNSGLIVRVRPLPCLAVVGVISRWVKSMSFTLKLTTSIGRSPLKDSCSLTDNTLCACPMMRSSFSFVGTWMLRSAPL